MPNNEKDIFINILLVVIIAATVVLLVYSLSDFSMFKNKKTAKVSSQVSFGSFDESIMANGMASKANIGKLGSQHIHADIKVYANGKALNFANQRHYMKSSFLHVDNNQNFEDASSVLHMHATNAPLWVFFRSIGMDLSKECLIINNVQKFCNTGKSTLKFYANGKPSNGFENYVFNDNDKILVSYGDETEEELIKQINSVTDYAKNH